MQSLETSLKRNDGGDGRPSRAVAPAALTEKREIGRVYVCLLCKTVHNFFFRRFLQ